MFQRFFALVYLSTVHIKVLKLNTLSTSMLVKRLLMASAFLFLFACQPSDEDAVSEVSTLDRDQASIPLLSLSELMSASDFQEGIKQAVINDDRAALVYWQEQALLVANEANLLPRELELISGEQGLVYIEYQAKKQLFNDSFVERFLYFQEIDSLINQYPYLTGLHERARKLVAERDALVLKAIEILENDAYQGNARIAAEQQWRDYVLQSGLLDKL